MSASLAGLLRESPIPQRFLVKGHAAYSVGRFWHQWLRGRYGRFRHGGRHDQGLLFVAGLPKSGTSWVESMLASFAGYQEVMLPSVIFHEVHHAGSHDFELEERDLERLEGGLFVLKLHAHGSSNNAEVLRRRGLRYAVVYRDLRDVAVSHYFYVRRTPWHPEHAEYRGLDVQEGLEHFSETLLRPFADWIMGWHRRADEGRARIVRYEDLLDDALGELAGLVEHFGIGTDPAEIERIQQAHSFNQVTGGRERGKSDEDSFVRKGVSGDWKNHFTPRLERRFESVARDALEIGGYLD